MSQPKKLCLETATAKQTANHSDLFFQEWAEYTHILNLKKIQIVFSSTLHNVLAPLKTPEHNVHFLVFHWHAGLP